MKPNYEQAVRWLGRSPPPARAGSHRSTSAAASCSSSSGAQLAAVTLDVDGALVFERDAPPYRTFAKPERQSRSTGAGDTFASALTLALAAGAETPAATELASAAAGVVVAKDSTARCTAFELRQRLFADDKVIRDRERLRERAEYFRGQDRRIVFTNGVFDILHRGHVAYLNRAKMLGDVLIVGVNSDDSVRRLKGPERPVNTLEDRMQVLAGLSGVDHVVPFGEGTPVDLIRTVRPHVFAKGGDYDVESLPEAPVVRELGGSVTILPLVPDRSTTTSSPASGRRRRRARRDWPRLPERRRELLPLRARRDAARGRA